MEKDIWTAYEAAAATGGVLCARGGIEMGPDADQALPEESWTASGLSIDTRTMQAGDLFVALSDTRDGHDFVSAAFEAGAGAALVSKVPDGLPEGVPLLMVPDTLTGVTQLARAARDRCFGKFIAVTGSAGKTSTKEMLRIALAPSGRVHAADKSFNNHLGVPLTLAQLPCDADFGVFEIGMNHGGEITPLSCLIQPHIAVITLVAAAHLEHFNSVEAIAEAKAEIFTGLRPGGVAVLPRDNSYYDFLFEKARDAGVEKIVSFGEHAAAECRLVRYEEGCPSVLTLDIGGTCIQLELGIPGRHQAMNALATLSVLVALGADIAAGARALAQMRPVEGRGARYFLNLGGRIIEIIDESYNANPASMAAAIRMLGTARKRPARMDPDTGAQANPGAGPQVGSQAGARTGRRVAVLGEMRELGPASAGLHAALADDLIMANITRVYAVGAMMRHLFESLPQNMRGKWVEDAEDLAKTLIEDLENGDIVMAKGSNASKVGDILELLRCAAAKSEPA